MALEPAKLSDFKLAGSLGSGATARVYEATQIATGRPVAIKMMEDSGSTPEMRERFAREAILLSGVQSRHVSKIVGFGFEKGQPFLVLERLAGETLDAKLRRDGPPRPKVAVKWIEQLIIGIRDCHDAKIIHRDIKPSNIFLHREALGEMVKVIDFGVARLRELTDDGSSALTSANHLIGSMGYMAPEQFTNAKGVHFTADLYAIGVVIFRTLTGRLPFVSRNLHAVIKMKSEQVVPAISSMPGMPQNPLLDWFVQKATDREPNARFKNAREMLDQWWNVMSSFEEHSLTEVSRAASALAPIAPASSGVTIDDEDTSDANLPFEESSSSELITATGADEEDRTLHKPNRFPSGAPSSLTPSIPASSSSEHTIQRAMSFPLPSDIEEAPHTIRQPDEAAAFADDMDPFDMPTKSDPNLKKLVERELALQRARREGPK